MLMETTTNEMEGITKREMRNFLLYDCVHATYLHYMLERTSGSFSLYLAVLDMWRALAK